MELELITKIMNSLYEGIDGYMISSSARKKLPFYDKAHTYGEVLPESFQKILAAVEPKKNEVFYDLGSGTGKAVFLSALLFPFSKVVGIEKLSELWQTSRLIQNKFDQEVRPGLPNEKKDLKINLVRGDFLEVDFFDADIIFAHSTCFHDEFMDHLQRRFLHLKKGARIITVTKNLTLPILDYIKTEVHRLSWGNSTIHYYQKAL